MTESRYALKGADKEAYWHLTGLLNDHSKAWGVQVGHLWSGEVFEVTVSSSTLGLDMKRYTSIPEALEDVRGLVDSCTSV